MIFEIIIKVFCCGFILCIYGNRGFIDKNVILYVYCSIWVYEFDIEIVIDNLYVFM